MTDYSCVEIYMPVAVVGCWQFSMLLVPFGCGWIIQPILIGQAISLFIRTKRHNFLKDRSLSEGLNIPGRLTVVVSSCVVGTQGWYRRWGKKKSPLIFVMTCLTMSHLYCAFFDRTPVGRRYPPHGRWCVGAGDIYHRGDWHYRWLVLVIVIAMFSLEVATTSFVWADIFPVAGLIIYFQQYHKANYKS